MKEFIGKLRALITDNPVLIAAGVLLAFFNSVNGIMQKIASPVLRDGFIVLLGIVTAALLVRYYVHTAHPSFTHARDKLKANPWRYAIAETWVALSITVILLVVILAAVSVPAQALATHAMPPYTAVAHQKRLPAECRKCPILIDGSGRQTGSDCLKTDPGGVVNVNLDRWRDYRPVKIKAICTNGSSTEVNLD
ncbi:hypothetical protein J2045_004606 [Peteryoungia aggregata LMG 23059]|uniref:Uncharacterized protein n=1 Tax=Peteryoungia aggregata LMG 23059 TaxID=1368425 RepID=A0ABU0GDW2_9HYPH|nr:hypothetical protein [Peteryoungia aggregata]MDQ0423554.1 hypothetical protein [Peteryoungia aggregata LMG 23059]